MCYIGGFIMKTIEIKYKHQRVQKVYDLYYNRHMIRSKLQYREALNAESCKNSFNNTYVFTNAALC